MLATPEKAKQRWHVDVLNPDANQVLVLLHGWGMHSELWHPFVEQLSTNLQIHLIDLPGCGNNRQIESNYDIDDLSQQLIELIPDGADVIGWSLGGLLASQCAICDPKKINKLIFMASSPYFTTEDEWPGIAKHDLQRFAEDLNDDPCTVMQHFFQLQCLGLENYRQTFQQLKKVWGKHPIAKPFALEGGLKLLQSLDYRDWLIQHKQATLMIFGEFDKLVPYQIGKLLQHQNPQIESHILPKATHMPFFTHTEACAKIVGDWLA